MEDLQDLMKHLEWADAALWRQVLESTGDSLDSRVESWLYHVHSTQHAFTCMWRGEPIEVPELSRFANSASLIKWGREAHGKIQAFLGSAGATELEKDLEVPFKEQLEKRWKGPISSVTVGQSILQVALHSTHHRGQIATRLREIGGEPPIMDFIAWLWQGRPEPSWPEGP